MPLISSRTSERSAALPRSNAAMPSMALWICCGGRSSRASANSWNSRRRVSISRASGNCTPETPKSPHAMPHRPITVSKIVYPDIRHATPGRIIAPVAAGARGKCGGAQGARPGAMTQELWNPVRVSSPGTQEQRNGKASQNEVGTRTQTGSRTRRRRPGLRGEIRGKEETHQRRRGQESREEGRQQPQARGKSLEEAVARTAKSGHGAAHLLPAAEPPAWRTVPSRLNHHPRRA